MPESRLILNEEKIKEIMEKASIPGVSIAFVSDRGKIYPQGISIQDNQSANNEVLDAMFEAASLSKPVFAYLVLKLIKKHQLHLTDSLNKILPFDVFCKDQGFKWDGKNNAYIEKMTVQMALSHTTGLNLTRDDKVEFLFEPGKEYAYSNIGLFYLQSVVEKITKKLLQQLA